MNIEYRGGKMSSKLMVLCSPEGVAFKARSLGLVATFMPPSFIIYNK